MPTMTDEQMIEYLNEWAIMVHGVTPSRKHRLEIAARLRELAADNAKMRTALEQIATCVTQPISPEYLSIDRAKALARTALGEKA